MRWMPPPRGVVGTFFMTSFVPRTMWKYNHSHAYRVLLLDAGHLGQTFHLVCTALGLGPFTTAAINGACVEGALGIDGTSEIVVYGAATGFPKTTQSEQDSKMKNWDFN